MNLMCYQLINILSYIMIISKNLTYDTYGFANNL
jgi:hypothetical protein